MNDHSIPLQRWTDVAKLAIAETCSSSLGSEASMDEGESRPEPGLCGSILTLVSANNVMCLGLSSTAEGCRRLAGAMLGMDAAEAEELSHDDVRDSIGELVNILSGLIKTHLSAEDGALTLGLPLYISGLVEGDSRSLGRYVACRLGEVPCVLTLLLGGSARRSAA